MIPSKQWTGPIKSCFTYSIFCSMLCAFIAGCSVVEPESAPSTETSIPVTGEEEAGLAKSIKINPNSAAIVYSGLEISEGTLRDGLLPHYLKLAEDLQKHLELITGV